MTFNDFKAYRQIATAVLELKKLRKEHPLSKEPQSDSMAHEIEWMSQQDKDFISHSPSVIIWAVVVLVACIFFRGCEIPAHAEKIEGHDIQVWANAINKSENSTSHPYGILAHYKHTTPRQACINTVRHQYRIWCKNSCNKPFLAFLASKYAPLYTFNDPFNLNSHWVSNVSYFLKEGDA